MPDSGPILPSSAICNSAMAPVQEAAEDAVAAANPHTRLITAAQAAANALSQKVLDLYMLPYN